MGFKSKHTGLEIENKLDAIDKIVEDITAVEESIKELENAIDSLPPSLDEEGLLNILAREKYTDETWVTDYVVEKLKDYLLKEDMIENYIDTASEQEIEGIKNFINGLRINSSPVITYDEETKSFILDGNLIISGDFAIRAVLGDLDVQTIMDGIMTDNTLIIDRSSGTPILKINPDYDFGGIDEDYLEDYLDIKEYTTKSDVDTILTDYATKDYVTEASSNKWTKPVRTITANTTLSLTDYMVVVTTRTKVTITLPNSSTIKQGQSFEIFGRNSGGITLTANKTIYRAQGANSTSHDINAGYFHAMMTYDGTYWLLSITENS